MRDVSSCFLGSGVGLIRTVNDPNCSKILSGTRGGLTVLAQVPDQELGISSFQQRLGYEFTDATLLQKALTHASFGRPHNERLEFLGDAVLKFVLSKLLYDELPEHEEGILTIGRTALEKNTRLAQLANELGMAAIIRMGKGARKDGIVHSDSVMAGALEAVVAAMYQDGGLQPVEDFVHRVFKFETIVESPFESRLTAPNVALTHPKTALQELTIKMHGCYPKYTQEKVEQDGRLMGWKVLCTVPGTTFATKGECKSTQEAESEAAQKMLDLLRR